MSKAAPKDQTKDRTRDRILYELKAKGAMTAQQVADQFDLSLMGAHKSLQALADDGFVSSFDKAAGRGRPRRFFELTELGHKQFPDNHAHLTVELLNDVNALFGAEGLDRIIAARESRQRADYQNLQELALEERINTLAQKRAQEGYMARVDKQENGDFLLVEDHCPICAAADACRGFCRAELALFQMTLGDDASIEREEHVLDGGRRCTYRISPSQTGVKR